MTAIRAALITIAAAAGGIGLGALATLDDGAFAPVLLAAAAVALLAVATSRILRARPAAAADDAATPLIVTPDEARFARVLFYLGCSTITFATWRPAGGLTVSEVFFILAFSGAFFEVLRGRAIAPVPLPMVAGAFVFAVGGLISTPGAVNPTSSGVETFQGIYVMLLWAWTGAMLLRSPGQFRLAIGLWACSAAVSGACAIAQYAGIPIVHASPFGGRMTAFTIHPNDLGGSSGVVLAPALAVAALALSEGRGRLRGLGWALLPPFIIAGLLLSGSVGGTLGALLAVTVWLASPAVPRGTRATVVILGVCGALAATAVGGEISPVERLNQVTSSSTDVAGGGSGAERVSTNHEAWEKISASPLIGVGMDSDSALVSTIGVGGVTQYLLIHSLPIAAWYSGGLLALLGILLVFVGVGRAALATVDTHHQMLAWAVAASLLASGAYLFTEPMFWQQYGWMPAVLLVSWWARARADEPAALRSQGGRRVLTPLPAGEAL